jgi:hypothetical protein
VQLTRPQQVALVVGLAIGLASFTTGPWLSGVLRLVGYPLALIVIVRWIPVVRQRLGSLFLLHQIGMGLIVAGWVLAERWLAVAINAAWFVVAGFWYLRRGRER